MSEEEILGFEIKGKVFLVGAWWERTEAFYLDLEGSVRFGHVEKRKRISDRRAQWMS